MKTRNAILALLIPSALAFPARAEWEFAPHDPIQTHDYVLLGTSFALIAADFSLSMDIKNHTNDCRPPTPGHTPICVHHQEGDALLVAAFGRHPTDGQFLMWEAGYMGVTAGIWYLAPEKVRWLVPTVVGLYEGVVVAHNLKGGLRFQLPAIHF